MFLFSQLSIEYVVVFTPLSRPADTEMMKAVHKIAQIVILRARFFCTLRCNQLHSCTSVSWRWYPAYVKPDNIACLDTVYLPILYQSNA
jgi:hypothetical protein